MFPERKKDALASLYLQIQYIYIIVSSDIKECFWNWVTIKWATSITTYSCRRGWRGYSHVRLRDWSNRQVSNVVVMSCTQHVAFFLSFLCVWIFKAPNDLLVINTPYNIPVSFQSKSDGYDHEVLLILPINQSFFSPQESC